MPATPMFFSPPVMIKVGVGPGQRTDVSGAH